jgi:hypothetical protein
MPRVTKMITYIHGPVLALENMADDRAAAVMAGAFLEYNLAFALRARMRDMTKSEIESVFDNHGHGALNTFSQKIWTGYALNLYGLQTRQDLLILKDIRNEFAHEPEEIDFNHHEIEKLCKKLGTPKKLSILETKSEENRPRIRYMDTIHFFATRFHIFGEKHVQRPGDPPNLDLD